MHPQKDDAPAFRTDIFRPKPGSIHKIMTKMRTPAMRTMHCGHAAAPIASQLQHDYLPSIEGE